MSPPSSKKAKKGKAAATPRKGDQPEMGVYTGLMFVAFAALVCGIVILVFQLNAYEWQGLG